jgi:hypothetical protein
MNSQNHLRQQVGPGRNSRVEHVTQRPTPVVLDGIAMLVLIPSRIERTPYPGVIEWALSFFLF